VTPTPVFEDGLLLFVGNAAGFAVKNFGDRTGSKMTGLRTAHIARTDIQGPTHVGPLLFENFLFAAVRGSG
jgi:hypothetical protein